MDMEYYEAVSVADNWPVSHPEFRQQRLAELEERVHPPFNNNCVLPAFLDLAEQLDAGLASYDLVVGEDTSGRLTSLLYWRMINKRRHEQGLGAAAIRFINGRFEGALPNSLPKASAHNARTLIVTEYVCSGGSARRVYGLVGRDRIPGSIDIAAAGSMRSSLALETGSTFYYAPKLGDYEIDNFLSGNVVIKGVSKFYARPYSHRAERLLFKSAKIAMAREDIRLIADALYAMLPLSYAEGRRPRTASI
jgi:hypothetical protein